VAHPSNLHLIYEILPMAFLIEKAGGMTDDGTGHSVLDTKVSGYAQRVSFIAGNMLEV
jgi:fructose-1,6-bisphosphatase